MKKLIIFILDDQELKRCLFILVDEEMCGFIDGIEVVVFVGIEVAIDREHIEYVLVQEDQLVLEVSYLQDPTVAK